MLHTGHSVRDASAKDADRIYVRTYIRLKDVTMTFFPTAIVPIFTTLCFTKEVFRFDLQPSTFDLLWLHCTIAYSLGLGLDLLHS